LNDFGSAFNSRKKPQNQAFFKKLYTQKLENRVETMVQAQAFLGDGNQHINRCQDHNLRLHGILGRATLPCTIGPPSTMISWFHHSLPDLVRSGVNS
jgi:hypothetical protein